MSVLKTFDFNGRNQQKNRRIFSVCHIWYKNCKRISRVLFGKFLFRCDHLSRTHVTVRLQLPLRHDGRRISLFCGIAPDRVYTNRRRYRRPGGLLPRLFTLTDCSDVLFCCTVPGVASGGRYPLSFPWEARTFLIIRPCGMILRDCLPRSTAVTAACIIPQNRSDCQVCPRGLFFPV